MKKLMTIFWAVLCIGIVSSCVPATPQKRIQERPDLYGKLNQKHKELVSKGEIVKGMSKDAVFLAWGRPSAQIEVMREGEFSERWDYEGSQPVTKHHFFGGYSSGAYGPWGYSGYRAGFGPEVVYIPYRKASVWFVKGLVDEWERQK